MAVASATSLSATFSSLSLNPLLRRNPCLSSSHRLHFPASKPPFPLISQPLHKPSPPRVKPSDLDTTYFDTFDLEAITTFNPPEPPEGFIPPPSFDEGPLQSKEDIERAYEEIYGPFTTTKTTGIKSKRRERIRDGFLEKVVEVRRVTKIVKQGRQFHFRVVIVVGDKQGNVGVGVGKAEKVVFAIRKSAIDARKNIVLVPMTKYKTFPHRSEAYSGSAKVMLRPACPGTGVIAGGAVRIVLEMAGVQNALGKQLGSPNPLNNARATVVAIQKMRQFREVAEERGIPMEELWK